MEIITYMRHTYALMLKANWVRWRLFRRGNRAIDICLKQKPV